MCPNRWVLPVLLLAFELACAPAVNLRPPTPMARGRDFEMGVGFGAVSPRPVGEDPWVTAAQGWVTASVFDPIDVLLMGGYDGQYGTGGLGARFRFLEFEHFRGGVGLELGAGWIGIELPMAAKVYDGVWLYSMPHYGTWGLDKTIRLPLGIEVGADSPTRLRLEGQLNYPDFDPYKRRVHFGVGVGYQL